MTTLNERNALRERTHVPETAPPARRSTWIWWGVLIVVLAVSFVAAIWAFGDETAALPENVTGFDYDHEVTPIHVVALRAPMAYHGAEAGLDPDVGEYYFHETTGIQIATLRDPMPYHGAEAGLDPDVGEYYFHETTPIHIATLRDPMPYHGGDANLDPD